MLFALRNLEPLSSAQGLKKNTDAPKTLDAHDRSLQEDWDEKIVGGSTQSMSYAERNELLKNPQRQSKKGTVSA
ncbi:MAG: hypothetical protein ACFCU8_12470 [Thermosynechococcaceae cyanobacterium]